jgi:dipeptidyl aminopeptidase/acylaminoacyl peptidase
VRRFALVLGVLAACSGSSDNVDAQLLVAGSEGEIFTIDADGEHHVVLHQQEEGVVALQPTWSPDGSKVVWTELKMAGDGSAEIIIASQGHIQRLPSANAPFYYYWSPDGRRIAYLGNTGTGISLGLADLENDTNRPIASGEPFYLDWHPDGSRLAVHIGLRIIAFLDREGTSTPASLRPALFQAPAWTPDGRLLVAAQAEGATVAEGLTAQVVPSQLVLTDDGNQRAKVLAELDGFTAFTVSPTGDRVAYTDTLGGGGVSLGPLRVVSIEGGEPIEIISGVVIAHQWSIDGRSLLFISIDAEAGSLVPNVWDGDKTSSFTGFVPTRTFGSAYLPFWDQYARSLSLWSPKGDAFVYAAAAGEGEPGRVMVQTIGGEPPIEVARGEFASWNPASD